MEIKKWHKFYFHTSLWCFKKVLSSWGTKKKLKNKNKKTKCPLRIWDWENKGYKCVYVVLRYIKTILTPPELLTVLWNNTSLKVFIKWGWHFQRVTAKYSGFDLMTRNSYFMILVEVFKNHILVENTYLTNCIKWPKQKIIHNFHHHVFLYQAKVLKTSEPK